MREYPLTAMVGYDDFVDAASALLCSPDLRSLLIVGGPGTGKSVAARATSQLSGFRKVVNMPASSDSGQAFGTLDLESAIRSGKAERSDSVLSRADGNILVIDDANLMRPELLLSILDAAEEGIATPESSPPYAVDVKVVCTANPDEGEIDSHVLDRFDMCVFVEPVEDEDGRKEIVRRRLAFDRDLHNLDNMEGSVSALRSKVSCADPSAVAVPREYPGYIAEICREMNIEGHRGDVATLNAACALASLDGRDALSMKDLSKAARLCLRHRRRDLPEAPREPQERSEPQEEENRNETEDSPEEERQGEETRNREADDDGEDSGQPEDRKPQGDRVFAVGEEFDVKDYVPEPVSRNPKGRGGRRDYSVSDDGTGHAVGYVIPRERIKSLALSASIIAAAPKQPFREHDRLAVVLKGEDLRENVKIRRRSADIVFVVDGSGSMGAKQRMTAVKGAVLSLLNDAYRRRDRIGMAVFRGDSAEECLPLTRSVLAAYRRLEEMPTGGRTPLFKGLLKGIEMLDRSHGQTAEPVMVVLTDGRGNSKDDGPESLRKAAGAISSRRIRTIVVDTETGLLRFGKAMDLAMLLEADYVALEELSGRGIRRSLDMVLGR